jgi:hypothetical protein
MAEFLEPIWRSAVVKAEPVFIVSSDPRRLKVLRSALDGFAGEANINAGISPTHAFNPRGGD